MSGRQERSQGQSGALEDPLCFVLEALLAEGALAARAGDRPPVLLPPALSARLALTEQVELAVSPDRPGDTAAGLGTPLLEKLVGEACKSVPAASVRVCLDPPRPSQARSIAERFAL